MPKESKEPLALAMGSIRKVKTDAIVNAANTSLLGGSGVDGAIRRAAEHGCTTVAFPSISTGIYRFPLHKASVIAVKTIPDFLKLHSNMEVQMVCFEQKTFHYYQQALEDALKTS